MRILRSRLPIVAVTMMILVAASACRATAQFPETGRIVRLDPAFDRLVPADARIEKLAEGFDWSEGPLWVPRLSGLLFSDVPRNTIYKWTEAEGIRIYLRPAGYAGPTPLGRELGTNGLTLDLQGRLVACDHGNRRVVRMNDTLFTGTTLVDRYEGKRLNSPNDLVFHSNGDLYFTDPPYGLAGLNEDPNKELDFNGVYRLSKDGRLDLLTREIAFPNGIAFSPDEKTLYVASSDEEKPLWMAYDVREDGLVTNGRIFKDAKIVTGADLPGSPDGMTVDRDGNLWATGPGGVHVFAPDGRELGLIETGVPTANCKFGGPDGSTLFITAGSYVARLQTRTSPR